MYTEEPLLRWLKDFLSSAAPNVLLGWYMDKGTLKTPIPWCCLHWSLCLGWWSNFVGSKSGQKQSVKLLQNMVYSTIQHPPQPPTVCIYCTFSLGRGGGEVREKVEGQQYTSIVPSSMGATDHKLGPKYQPWVNVSPVQCCGSGMFIPDPGSWLLPIPDPGPRIPDLGSRIQKQVEKRGVKNFFFSNIFL
jgi:hypothetical protein